MFLKKANSYIVYTDSALNWGEISNMHTDRVEFEYFTIIAKGGKYKTQRSFEVNVEVRYVYSSMRMSNEEIIIGQQQIAKIDGISKHVQVQVGDQIFCW